MVDKVELLAPAGNYDAFLGALNAGADAVYLGGGRFGARAYADNFDEDQIVRALHVAHFYGKRIYLTVNTLLKERDLAGLTAFLTPFYEAGLDGVIVQDFGVFCHIRQEFPGLPLHVSTQMTVTGKRGAAFLKEQGARRIVPARELSLMEVQKIKEETGVEVECFIHGAMCYCYSGQCLFSSILGGRSGNRGRCAQPCRLPYTVYDGEKKLSGSGYPLSLKDMCTLEYLPKLLAAGIDSFKIEGRMKRPEYAAGVTAVYRKYIDLYYREGADNYRVDPVDMDKLRSLYIRSEIQTGYYERHNGKEMITLEAPGYSGSDEALLYRIRERYVREPEKIKVRMQAAVKVGEPLYLQITSDEGLSAEVWGEPVQQAKNAPLTKEEVKKRLCRTGESLLFAADCEVSMEGEGFVPVRALNELRRKAVEAYELAVVESRSGRFQNRSSGESVQEQRLLFAETVSGRSLPEKARAVTDCLVSTLEQLRAVVEWGRCRRIFVESDLFLKERESILRIMAAAAPENSTKWCLALPYVLRERDEAYLERLLSGLSEREGLFSGFLVRNLEELAFGRMLVREKGGPFGRYALIPDAGLYSFNAQAVRFLAEFAKEITIPYELNAKEAAHLADAADKQGIAVNLIVYSRIPMMITANCLQKTAGLCQKSGDRQKQIILKDRYGAAFPVVINCEHCYNVVYNSVPYSLHGAKKERDGIGAAAFRYDFVIESGMQCRQILEGKFPFESYTAGHCKRGVE